MAPTNKRVKFIDDEAQVSYSTDEEEEEENAFLDGFLFDDSEELLLNGRPRLPVSATGFGVNDLEGIENYVESVKRRTQESNRIGGSSAQDQSLISRHPHELWMLPVPAGIEKILAVSLLEISKTRGDCEIQTFHNPCFPRRIYIKAPGILEIQELMKFSAYGPLVSRATRIIDDIDLNLLLGTNAPDVPCPGSWVRIRQACIYKGDLALVLFTPSEGDIVTIVVVPRFSVSQSKKRKSNGLFARAAPAPALLDPRIVAKFPSDEHNVHSIGSRRFYPNGLEFLRTPSIHSLKIEPSPSEAELLLFQSSFGLLDSTYEHEHIIQRAVYEAFRNKSRTFWHAGDRVRILEGTFVNTSCSILEIDEANQSAIVEFGSPKPIRVEVMMYDLERQFLVGDQVRVALGENKGRTGSIVKIIDDVTTIVEGTASQLTELQVLSLYLESHTIGPSFVTTPHPAASSISEPKPSHESEAAKGHQRPGGRGSDPQIGREAAVYVGPMKGYRGRLIDISRYSGKIECPGRQLPTYTALLQHLVLIDTPTHNLVGTKLNRPYVARDLMRPEPSLPRTSTPPPPADDLPELTLEERAIELGSGAFLRHPQICAELEGFYIWVGFHVTYENGSYAMRHGHTPLPDRFTDADGQCPHHEVCIILTDHRTAVPILRRVELRHLKPVPPKKKGDWIVILSGDHQGVVAEVNACKTKASKAEVVINGAKMAFNFSDICRLTKPD